MDFDMAEFDFNMEDPVNPMETLEPLSLDIPNMDLKQDHVTDMDINKNDLVGKENREDSSRGNSFHLDGHLNSGNHQFLIDTPEHNSINSDNNQSYDMSLLQQQQLHVQQLQQLQQQQHYQMLNLDFDTNDADQAIQQQQQNSHQEQQMQLQAGDTEEGNKYQEHSIPQDSIQRTNSISVTNNSISTNSATLPKRTRASGEILRFLTDQFNMNSNPSSAQRKEIAEKTGMPERSVRIWFQNRRAKARKQGKLEKKDDSNAIGTISNDQHNNNNNNSNITNNHNGSNQNVNKTTPSSISNPSRTNSPFNLSASHPIEVNNKYYIMECKNLSIGNWQRIKAGYITNTYLPNLSPQSIIQLMSTTDLVVILSKKDAELNYFFSGVFQNEKVLFRIFYPVRNIIKCSLLNQTDPKSTTLNLELSHSPQFAVHFTVDPTTGEPNVNQWSICEDFSEGQQVTNAHYSVDGLKIPHILHDDLTNLKFLHTLITSIIKSLPTESFIPIINSPAKIDSNLDLFNNGNSNDLDFALSDLIPNNMMINDKDFLLDEFQ